MTGFLAGVLVTALVVIVWLYGPLVLRVWREVAVVARQALAEEEVGDLHRRARSQMQSAARGQWRRPFEP